MQPTNSAWPKFIAVIIFLAGITNILAALQPARFGLLQILEVAVPLEIFDASRTLTVISGLLLIILARGIWQRKHRAWTLSILVILASLVTHVLKRSSLTAISFLFIPLALLWIFRKQFTVRSTKLNIANRLKNLSFVLLLVIIYTGIGYFILQHQFNRRVTIQRVIPDYIYVVTGLGQDTLTPKTHRAQWFEDSLFTVDMLFIAIAFASFFAPFIQPLVSSTEDKEKIKTLVDRWGKDSISYFTLLPDKKYFFSKKTAPATDSAGASSLPIGAIAYKVSNGTAVVLGEPITDPQHYTALLQEFTTHMMECGLSTVFYLIGEKHLHVFEDLGLTLLKIGEEAIISVPNFSLEGSSMKTIRNSVSHVKSANVHFRWYRLDQIPYYIRHDIDRLHQQWLKSHSIPPLTFSLGFHPLPEEEKGYVCVAYRDSKLEAALSFLPYQGGQALNLDEILRDHHSTNGLIEALLAESMIFFKGNNIQEMSLGLVALADTQPDSVTAKLVQSGRRLLFRHFNQFYNYQSLFRFKNKFRPVWQPKYIAYTSQAELLKVAIAIIGVHTKRNLEQEVWQKFTKN